MRKQKEKGFFICIEGADGSGKTTQAKMLVENLRRKGFDAVYTTEPSSGKVGKFVRSFVLDREERVPAALEALLFAADRVDHVEHVIKPLLKHGKIAVCDRYVYSSLAYQGATGLDTEWIRQINQFALKPNLALLIDVPPEVLAKRLRKKKSVMETMTNQRMVRDAYLKLAQVQRLVLVDGDRPVDDVTEVILDIALEALNLKS